MKVAPEPTVQTGEKWIDPIVAWLREQVQAAGARGLVVGLSGGIDSATVAALCRRAYPQDSLGLIMPCHSSPQDEADARLAAEAAGIPTVRVDLTLLYDQLVAVLAAGEGAAEEDRVLLARANLKPRLRMITLYYHAALRGYLVAGTGNRSELEVGYFTKYGDGGVDLLPLGDLTKTEVRALARALGVPERIIARPPTAGLWEGQTDEGEMGLTYEELDRYLLRGEAAPDVRERIEAMRRQSEHKRRLPPVFPAH